MVPQGGLMYVTSGWNRYMLPQRGWSNVTARGFEVWYLKRGSWDVTSSERGRFRKDPMRVARDQQSLNFQGLFIIA